MKNFSNPGFKTSFTLVLITFFQIFGQVCHSQQITFDWAKQIGANGNGYGAAIAEDKAGNFIVTGSFSGTFDFDPGPAVYQISNTSLGKDAYVAKYNADGGLLWAHLIKGQSITEGTGIAVDESGNIYITGFILGAADFDFSEEEYILNAENVYRNYILKVSPDGQFIWAHLTGRFGFEARTKIDMGTNGNIIVVGIFSGNVDFDPGPESAMFMSHGTCDSYILSLDQEGNLVWIKIITGSQNERIYALSVSDNGDLLISGWFVGYADFDPGADKKIIAATSSPINSFVLKLDPEGNFIWVNTFTGTGQSIATSVKIAPTGEVFIAATLNGTIDFDAGTAVFNLTKEGPESMVLVKLNADGEFINAVQFGENDYFNYPIIALDNNNNIYLTGSFTGSSDFDPGPTNVTLTTTGITDLFYAVFDNQLNLLSAVHCPGQRVAACRAIIITTNGAVLSTGFFERTVDFDPGTADYSLTSPTNNADIFLLQLNSSVSAAKDLPVVPGLAIFPNPAHDHLFIDVPESSDLVVVEIVDSRGNILLVRNIENHLTQTPVELQTGHLNTGNYIVRLTSKEWISSSKLVIINN